MQVKAVNPKVESHVWMQMGVELEGCWLEHIEIIAAKARGAQYHNDISVRVGKGYDGEVVTRPVDNLVQLCEDVKILYPNFVNDSCGFHIHTSFNAINTSILADKAFFTYFKERWFSWGAKMKIPKTHEFYTRLLGKNKFAQDLWQPEKQLARGAGSGDNNTTRRTMLNFCAWEKWQTLECRLLPMFSSSTMANEAIHELSDIYDTYLRKHTYPEVDLKSELHTQGETIIETYETKMPSTVLVESTWEDQHPWLPSGPEVQYAQWGNLLNPDQDLGTQETP